MIYRFKLVWGVSSSLYSMAHYTSHNCIVKVIFIQWKISCFTFHGLVGQKILFFFRFYFSELRSYYIFGVLLNKFFKLFWSWYLFIKILTFTFFIPMVKEIILHSDTLYKMFYKIRNYIWKLHDHIQLLSSI